MSSKEFTHANSMHACKEIWPDLDENMLLALGLRALLTLTVDKRPDNRFPIFTDDELQNEQWKIIDEHPKCFISDLGRVRGGVSGHNRVRKQSIQTGGYAVVVLTGPAGNKQFQVSRLVAAAFLGQPQSGQVLNHINGNKLDNRKINVEWTSQDKNIAHSNLTGLRERPSKLFARYSKDAHEEIRHAHLHISKSILAKIYGVKSSEIEDIIRLKKL